MFWPELIFVTNITNYIRGEKIFHVEKFQLSMYDNYGEIENLEKFGKNWEILRNFGKFCHNLRAFMWRKIEPKSTFLEKKCQIWGLVLASSKHIDAAQNVTLYKMGKWSTEMCNFLPNFVFPKQKSDVTTCHKTSKDFVSINLNNAECNSCPVL